MAAADGGRVFERAHAELALARTPAVPHEASARLTADLRWLLAVAVALFVLCGLPYLISARAGPPDVQRIGTFWFSKDFSQYQSAMRQGARQSSWLIHDHFSSEPHQAALMYPLYVGAGKAASALGLSDLTIFTALEWAGRLGVLGGVYAFTAAFVADRRTRRLALVLTLATLGLDAWVAPLRMLLESAGVQVLASLLPDTIDPYLEMSSFGVLLSAPHLMFGLALTLACAPLYLRAIGPDGEPLWVATLGAAVLALSLVHSFNTPVLVSVLMVHAALSGRRAWPAAGVAAIAAAPMAMYSVLLYQTDPFWSGTYSAQNLMPAPEPWALPFDFGLVLLAAPLAWPIVRHWPAERRSLILLWVGLGLAWMYVPVTYQRRFAFGVQPALAILASIGLIELNAWLRRRQVGGLGRRAVNYSAVVAAMSTSLLVYVALLGSAALNQPAEVYLWSRPEAAAAAWLGEHSTSDDVVLATTELANPLVGAIDGRVVHGHSVATLHSAQKAELVQRFFSGTTSNQERATIVAQTGATVVALGPRERALGAGDLSAMPGLGSVYDHDGVQWFRVQ